jgi:hypothetical protein
MSSTQGFGLDVMNNTGRTVIFQITGNTFLVGAIGTAFTISAGQWLSGQNTNAPLPLVLNDNDTGSLNFIVQDVSTGETGSFILEFDGTPLVNYPGMVFYGAAGEIDDAVQIAGVGYIFPLLYINQLYNGNPLAVLVLVEALAASTNVNTPYSVG